MGFLDKLAEILGHKPTPAVAKCTNVGILCVAVSRKDKPDTGVAGIKVSLKGPSSGNLETDNTGIAEFQGRAPGAYEFSVVFPGAKYKDWKNDPYSGAVSVTGGKVSFAEVRAYPVWTLVVEVRDETGGLIAIPADILTNGVDARGFRPPGGTHTFNNVVSGEYAVTAQLSAEIYESSSVTSEKVVVPDGGSVTATVTVKRRQPEPTISVKDPKVIVVKRDYHGKNKPGVKPHRLPIKLGVVSPAGGKGTLTCNHADQVALYTAEDGGTKLALPLTIELGELATGKTVWAEGLKPSTALKGTEFTLALDGTTVPPKVASVKDTLTCVKLKLDVYKARPEDNSEPVVIDDAKKIDPGRAVLVQGTTDKRLWAQRAKMVLAKAEPADYAGKLVLKPITGGGEAFAADKEKPASGQAALSGDGLKFANASIDQAKGTILWVQGKTLSAAMSDTGWKVELEELPDKEGDRVTMTAIQAELALYKSRTDAAANVPLPAAFSDDDKFDKGRYVHLQDDGFHHGRAMIVVKKVKPDGFDGTLVLTCHDSVHSPSYSGTKAATPKVNIFDDEVAASGQAAKAYPFEIPHPVNYPADGKAYWVEGAKVSAKLRDAELRLGVKEADIGCDRVELSVVRFKKLNADIPSTPGNQVRKVANGGASNSPVPRHTLLLADPPTKKNYDEDFAANEPLVLIEDSVQAGDLVNLTVEIEPAGLDIPVRWSHQRDKSGTGDHADIRALHGNDDLTLTRKGDGADALKATLLLDNVGSFFIRPFIDCNGNDSFEHNTATGARIDRDPFIIMTLVVIRVVGVANNSVKNDAAFNPASTAGPGIQYVAGAPSALSTGNFAGTGNDAVSMDATARVIGGGADGKRGLNKLFAGWLNNELNAATSPGPGGLGEDVTHHFRRPVPPAPALGPAPPPPPLIKTRCFWRLDGAEIGGPMLDSGYAAQGTGGNTCTGTAGANGSPIAKTDHASGIGQSWQVTNPDSPGGGVLATAPTDALATVRRFTFNID